MCVGVSFDGLVFVFVFVVLPCYPLLLFCDPFRGPVALSVSHRDGPRGCEKSLLTIPYKLSIMITCTCCGKPDEPHRIISCCVCERNYKLDCVSVTAAVARQIRSDTSITWTCTQCKSVGEDLKSLKALILGLQREIATLKETFKSSSPSTSPTLFDVEKVVQEVSEREKRKKCVIFYGVPESQELRSRAEQSANDSSLITEVLHHLSVDVNTASPIRLGKYDPSRANSARPIKVELSAESAVFTILRNARKLKSSNWPNISISADRTPMQRDLYRQVKSELQRRTDGGEANLRIRYKNGVPTITKSNPQEN